MADRSSPKRWRGRLITLAVLYFTFLGGTFITDQRLWPRIAHHAIVTLILAVWVVTLLRRGRSLPATPLDWPILVTFLVNVLATVFAVDPRVSVEALWQLGVHVLFFYLIVDLMRAYRPRVILEPVFFAAAVVVLVGVFEFVSWYFGLGWLPIFRHGWFELGGLRDPIPPVIYRLSFTLTVSTFLSGYLALLIPVGLAWALATRVKDTRRGLILWLVGALVVEGLSFSRGGLLSLAVSLPAVVLLVLASVPGWRERAARLLRDWRVCAALVGVVVIVALLGLGWARQNLAGHRSGDVQRLDLWRSAWQIGLSDPLTGVGPGGYGRALRLYRNPQITRDHITTPHNVPFLIWAQAGLPGILALAWLIGAAAWAGYRRWRAADGPDRIRLAGVCAALLGFAAHNLFDTLTATPITLPVLALVGYLVTPLAVENHRPVLPRRWPVPAALLALLALSAVGWAFSDWAQYHFARSIRLADSGDLRGALDAIEAAQRIDPAMGFYAAQRAQYVGQLAAGDDAHLPDALAAYEAALAREGTYDLMRANYAMLLAGSGGPAAARQEMEQAARIRPRNPHYHLWVGALAEEMGDRASAEQAYRDALALRPEWATSRYWDTTPVREGVRVSFLETEGIAALPLDALAALPAECWPVAAGDDPPEGDPLCAGEVALRLDGDPGAALTWLDGAVAANRADGRAYALRAEAHLALDDPASAGHDARMALFLGEARANIVLGKIAEAEGDLDAAAWAYEIGGPLTVQLQGWDVAVYARRGSLMLLPLLDAPGPSRYDFASWVALAELYTRQGRVDEAGGVYDVILALDPYYEIAP
jgi:tetratricopeptide (TPR) repeat protein/O-antigen ligase